MAEGTGPPLAGLTSPWLGSRSPTGLLKKYVMVMIMMLIMMLIMVMMVVMWCSQEARL